VFFVVWAIASHLAKSALFPGPIEVAKALYAAAREGTLVRAIVVSALRLVFGYALALVIGVPLGVGIARGPGL
jgi:NitT/TauT family transport system permease protein